MTQSPRQFDRRALFATGSAAALLAAVGVSAHAAPERGGHIKVALSGGDRSETWLDRPGGLFLQAARNAVFETLTEIAPDGTLHPGLAVDWVSSQGGLQWTFTIRNDVKFHNGASLQPRDVAASLNIQPSVATTALNSKSSSVRVTLQEADLAFPFTVADGAWPIFSADELDGGNLPVSGTGPYRVVRFDAGRGFLGQRFEDHYKDGQAGWFDTVELVAISSETVRAEAVRDGYVDAADLSGAHDLAGRGDIQLMQDDAGHICAALRDGVLHASRLGPHPLDGLRFATRWWMQT